MSAAQSDKDLASVARQEGWCLFRAGEALLKGVLEADTSVELIVGPRSEVFAPLLDLADAPPVSELLVMHGTDVRATPSADRAVSLAAGAAVSEHRAIALVPNDELDHAMPALDRASRATLGARSALCVILEDDPQTASACPRQAARRLGLTCLEPGTLEQLRDLIEPAVRLSRAGRAAVAVVVHRSILRSVDTLQARPNRVADRLTSAGARPQRRQRVAEMGGVLRMARRLELNRTISVPSPGERLPLGFIVVGPASAAINHLIAQLRLHGRVPVLHLGLLNPIDESVVQRMLGRCEQVVVLEPRPGSIEADVLSAAQSLRRRGERPALLGCRSLTDHDPDDGQGGRLEIDEAIHPSLLARRVLHLLHLIRPGLELPFMPDPPQLSAALLPRGAGLGEIGALARVRADLADVDQWLRDRGSGDGRGAGATALAVDGVEPAATAGQRVVSVETWSSRRFMEEGIASLRQAAWDDQPRVLVICAVGAQPAWRAGEAEVARDLERLVRGAVPGLRADTTRIEIADLNDRQALRSVLRELVTGGPLGVVIARDGPPPRYDVTAVNRSLAEIDLLGYEPRLRLLRPADEPCAVEPPAEVAAPRVADASSPPLRTSISVGRLSGRMAGRLALRVRPMLEEVEVFRARPPAFAWMGPRAERPAPPKPIHGGQPFWRAHLAGFRGEAPGVAAWTLARAGREMGYHVRGVHDPAPIGPGRWAWAQILFTRPGRDHEPPAATATIPYGEADLLLGLDPQETMRAIDPAGGLRVANLDRTCAVVNLGAFADEPDADARERATAHAVRAVTLDGHRMTEDFAAACRAAFHTDRLTDLALLGAAFQCGMIPVSLDAMDQAARHAEAGGFGRAREAVLFGCHLAADQRLFLRRARAEEEDLDRQVRRIMLGLRLARWGGRIDADHLAALLRRSLDAMPGLTETDPGRAARRDFVMAVQRCLAWGGIDYARRYAELVTNLYGADRGDKGRAVTRNVILPLAEAMLIRDPLYVGMMATSPTHRAWIRRRLNARPARGDRIERRYLTRIELMALRRRLRLDLRTTDWPARLAAIIRKRVPRRWRGTALERKIRDEIINVARRAVHGTGGDYHRWSETMQRLHDQVVQQRLRGMAVSELRMLLEEGTKGLRD